MKRFSRISTVWRKEFADTLRDRRTLAAMVLVPMVLYPVLMLGSLLAFEVQVGRLKQEQYTVAVESQSVKQWLRSRIIDPDLARHADVTGVPAEDMEALVESSERTRPDRTHTDGDSAARAEADVRQLPPEYDIRVFPDVAQAVEAGRAHVGVLLAGDRFLRPDEPHSVQLTLLMDQTEIRSQIAAAGLEGILQRANQRIVARRLADANLPEDFVRPIGLTEQRVASAEKVGGSVLGQVVPLILVIMTLMGAVYPAIDLTAGERERGTLETLMAAPVPTVDLIAGKFVVVASIGMLSAVLNLLSIGGSIYLGGLGDMLTQGAAASIPLRTLPLVLVVLIPLAIMFSALLLAVCSFARSFKEAQNYVMPVTMAALIPAVIGILPGTELEGPLLIMPVTNIVILTRDLFMGQIDHAGILWVTLSTSIYAGAAVAVAAKLFGQEAVLFSDSASIKTLLHRRFFKPSATPSASQALLLLAIIYSANFFIQQSLMRMGFEPGTLAHLIALAVTLIVLLVGIPTAVAAYARINISSALALAPPGPLAWLAAICIGGSTWILSLAWLETQKQVLPLPPDLIEAAQPLEQFLSGMPVLAAIFFLALVPALCEELFFRGFVLSGLRSSLGKSTAILITALAFSVSHYSVHRLIVTAGLGILLAVLVVQWRSVWPAVLAHVMHNALILMVPREDGLLPYLKAWGFVNEEANEVFPPLPWLLAAGGLIALALVLSIAVPRKAQRREGMLNRDARTTPSHESGGGLSTLDRIP